MLGTARQSLGASDPLLPRWADAAWREAAGTPIGQELVRQLAELEAADRRTPLPPLSAELYGQVKRTGERLPFERVWQERRRRLARAAVRLLLDPASGGSSRPAGIWWGQLLAAIEELLSEPSWAWPAHVQDPSGVDGAVIDLFAAETANLCGELVSLFGPWLPPAWVAAMRQRVIAGMVEPFVAHPEAYGWANKPSNWNAVCHQGLLGAALALDADGERVVALLTLVRRHLELFLAGFSAGGSCLEGITYWEYGFGWYALLNDQLERWSGSEQSLVAGQEDRIRAIARYGPAMLLRGGQLVNFADSRLDMPPRASLLMLLGRRLGLPECTEAGLRLYRQLLEGGLDLHGQRCDLLYLSRLLLEAPTAEAMAAAGEPGVGDWIDHGAGVVVSRRIDAAGHWWELAVKGGHNDEPHNHNDCGSFLLNIDGQRVAIELGAPEYTADTFGPKRYDLLATRSGGHSVPIVNGQEQAAGREYAAQMLAVEAGPSLVRVQLDLTRAYPAAAGHQRLVRTIVLDCAAGCLRVEDELWGTAGIELEGLLITGTDCHRTFAWRPQEGTSTAGPKAIRFINNSGRTEDARAWTWQALKPYEDTEHPNYRRIGFTIEPG